MSQKIMIHVVMRIYEGFITNDIWPMDMDYTLWIYNRTSKESIGLSSYEIWTRSVYKPHKGSFRNFQLIADLTYVLDPKLHK